MTEKIYYQSGYLREMEATVTGIDGNEVYLDKTIFYPEGGGQRGDSGHFGSHRIIDTRKKDGDVAHIFESVEGLEVGETATLTLDWDIRYKFMKCHSAQHLLSSILFNLKDSGTVAVHLGDEYITIEHKGESLTEEDLYEVEDAANRAIREGHRIIQKEVHRAEAESLGMRRSIKVDSEMVMLVIIEGLDTVACGGVHVADVSEIGEISYYGRETIRGHERLLFKVGDEAVSKRRRDLECIRELSTVLSSPESDIIPTLKSKLEQVEELKRENRRLTLMLTEMEAERIAGSYHETELPLDDFAPVLEKKGVEDVFILRNAERLEFLYFGSKEKFNELKGKLNLRGGGRPPLFRGIVNAALEEVREIFK